MLKTFVDRCLLCVAGTYLLFAVGMIKMVMLYGYSMSVAVSATVAIFTERSLHATALHSLAIGIGLIVAAASLWIDARKQRAADRHFSSFPSWRWH